MRHRELIARHRSRLLVGLGVVLGGVAIALAVSGRAGELWYALVALVVLLSVIAVNRYEESRREHERSIELAAAVAADDDPAFDPELVREQAEDLFVAVQHALARGDRAELAALLAPGLFTDSCRQLDERERNGWQRHIEVLGLDEIEYLGLVNRDGEADDRVTVRIGATVRDYVVTSDGLPVGDVDPRAGIFTQLERALASAELQHSFVQGGERPDEPRDIAEFWTLAKSAGGHGWVVHSIEGDTEGRHVLGADVVAMPWNDDRRLTDASRLEVAALDRLPAGMSPSEVADVDYAEQARIAALDLSVVDGRWAPFAMEAAVHRAVAAWAEAVDGAGRELLDVATPDAVQELLHPGDPSRRTRLVIRGPRVRSVTIVAVDPAARPPTMAVVLEVTGRRYVQDRVTGTVVSGLPWLAVTTAQRWTLALAGPDDRPWQIVAAADDAIRRTPSALADQANGLIRQFWTALYRSTETPR